MRPWLEGRGYFVAADALESGSASASPGPSGGYNLQTMQGVFDYEKQAAYADEVDQWFYPMLKQARRNYPRQYPAYENLKIILRIQCDLIRHIHAAVVAQG